MTGLYIGWAIPTLVANALFVILPTAVGVDVEFYFLVAIKQALTQIPIYGFASWWLAQIYNADHQEPQDGAEDEGKGELHSRGSLRRSIRPPEASVVLGLLEETDSVVDGNRVVPNTGDGVDAEAKAPFKWSRFFTMWIFMTFVVLVTFVGIPVFRSNILSDLSRFFLLIIGFNPMMEHFVSWSRNDDIQDL